MGSGHGGSGPGEEQLPQGTGSVSCQHGAAARSPVPTPAARTASPGPGCPRGQHFHMAAEVCEHRPTDCCGSIQFI